MIVVNGTSGDTIRAEAGSGSSIEYVLSGMELVGDHTTQPYPQEAYATLGQGLVPAVASAVYAPAAGRIGLVRSIFLVAVAADTLTIYHNTRRLITVTLAAGDFGTYENDGWSFYNAAGQRKGVGPAGATGAQGPAFAVPQEGEEGPEAILFPGPTGPRGPVGPMGPFPFWQPDDPDEPLLVVGPQGPVSASLKKVVEVTATGTYIPTPGLTAILAGVIAAGGGGGAAAQTVTNAGAGGGGGAGGMAWKVFTPVAASYPIVIGAGGAGGVVGGAAAGAGGDTTFNTPDLSATGGAGGFTVSGAVNGIASGASGGQGNTGNLLIPGGPGGFGAIIGTATGQQSGGSGGGFGGGVGSQGAVGNPAGGQYGGGGGGAGAAASSTSRNGGAGASGRVVVYEFG